MIEFELKDKGDEAYIELNKLLKVTQSVESGAMANLIIVEGLVVVNGEIDTRKRAKIRRGDVVVFEEITIKVI